MGFKKYLHVENLSNVEVEGILKGDCYIFPKLDGTNGSVWSDNGVIGAGSRKRELSLTKDNAGFYEWVKHNRSINNFFAKYGNKYRLFGEWLIPNHLRTYCDNVWRHFYIFDVFDRLQQKYLPYEQYIDLEQFGLRFIPCSIITFNPTVEYLQKAVTYNDYLIQTGKGLGEGIVIKNYKYKNKYGRFTYAKIVREECKQRQGKTKRKNKIDKGEIEKIIVDRYVTDVLCSKTYAKIVTETDGWLDKNIPYLLNLVFHDVVVEEIWDVLKKYKNPTINFKILQKLCNNKVKELKPEIF
jgi:hypothetical protein